MHIDRQLALDGFQSPRADHGLRDRQLAVPLRHRQADGGSERLLADIAAYVRHARRFGPNMVFEIAVRDGVGPHDLARLAQALRALPPWRVFDAHGRLVEKEPWSRFELARVLRRQLARRLVDLGAADAFIEQTIGVSRASKRGIPLNGGPDSPELAESLALDRAARNSNPGPKVIACPGCFEVFAQPPGRGRPRRFCSDDCRRAHQRRDRQIERIARAIVRVEIDELMAVAA